MRVDILQFTKRACKFGAQDLWLLILFLSWLSVLRALVPLMALAMMFQGQGGG